MQDTLNLKLDIQLEEDNFIRKYMDYAVKTSDAYQEYHYASALLLLSTAAGRRISIPFIHSSIYLNVWSFCLGMSTISRKTTAFQLAMTFLNDRFSQYKLPGLFSPEKFLDEMASREQQILAQDEAGALLKSMKKDYMAEMRDILAKLYDCKSETTRSTKSGGSIKIENPYLTQLLMTTDDNLKAYAVMLDITSGWLLRYIWFFPTYKKEWKGFVQPTNDDIKEFKTLEKEYGKLCTKMENKARELNFAPEALAYFNEWHRKAEEKAMETEDPITRALSARMATNAVKLAALFTVGSSDYDHKCMINLAHTREACRQVEEYFLPMGNKVAEMVHEASTNNNITKAKGILKRQPNGKMKHRDLLRTMKVKSKELIEVMSTLGESGEVNTTHEDINGQQVTFYQLNFEEPVTEVNMRKTCENPEEMALEA